MEETACADEGLDHSPKIFACHHKERGESLCICLFEVSFQFDSCSSVFNVFPYNKKIMPFKQTENQNQKAMIPTLYIFTCPVMGLWGAWV